MFDSSRFRSQADFLLFGPILTPNGNLTIESYWMQVISLQTLPESYCNIEGQSKSYIKRISNGVSIYGTYDSFAQLNGLNYTYSYMFIK